MPESKTIQPLITKLHRAGEAAGFAVEAFGQIGSWPLLGMTRAANTPDAATRHLYLSAGIHGDEPAGPQALLELLEADALPRTHHFTICPLLNPSGLSTGTRENADGIDLNRDYRDQRSHEIRRHAAWLARKIHRLDCSVLLHEDWESEGFYLYELNLPVHHSDRKAGAQHPGYADRILEATKPYLPTESASEIDGRAARDGIIRPEALPEHDEGDPEAIYLHRCYGGLNYTLETPSSQDLRLRIDALKAAVSAVL